MADKVNLADVAKMKAAETINLADRYIEESNLKALRALLVKSLEDQETAFRAMELLCGGREIPASTDQVGAIKEVALAAIELAKTQIVIRTNAAPTHPEGTP